MTATGMKPRLRLVRGMWQCGLPDEHDWCWAVAMTPQAAYELWARVFQRGDSVHIWQP